MSLPAQALEAPMVCIRFVDSVPVLQVPVEPGFEELREWLRVHLPEHLPQLTGHNTIRLDLQERELKLFDLRRILHLLREEFQLDVSGLYVRPESIHRYAERELKLKLFVQEPAALVVAPPAKPVERVELTEVPLPDPEESETTDPVTAEEPEVALTPAPPPTPGEPGRRTLSVQRTLRSGASIRFDGDVVLFGDVNPGAQIVAAGNIVVLGAMKGVAHAGATGAEDAFILGFEMRPTQIRIGRRIAIPPARGEQRASEPEIAHVVDGEIVIEPYRGKFR